MKAEQMGMKSGYMLVNKYSVNGNIKNCPALKQCYGNIDDINISNVINTQKFSSYWSITKDQIHTCKDCEFRYICTDCRAFIDNILDKPKKCNYNPYIGQWENTN